MPQSSMGTTVLSTIGTFAYNGVEFSSLTFSSVRGEDVKDSSGRTIMYVKYTFMIEGVVTLDDLTGDPTVDAIWQNLRKKLSAQAGILTYSGKGFGDPFVVNVGNVRDVAWGPIPEVLEFVPLGASRSARIKWTCTTCIPEVTPARFGRSVLQFNFETDVSYEEDGYSTIGIRGTLEIPLTRPNQAEHALTQTVDNFRQFWLNRIAADFDLTRFRVTRRDIAIDRSKRVMEWSFSLEELPPQGLPVGLFVVHGSYSVRPARAVRALMGSVNWIATLRVSYGHPKGQPRRLAWLAFANLWNFRMRQSAAGAIAADIAAAQAAVVAAQAFLDAQGNFLFTGEQLAREGFWGVFSTQAAIAAMRRLRDAQANLASLQGQRAWPISFSFNEGLYLDSKTTTFESSWTLITRLSNLLAASGIWTQLPTDGGNLWATSVRPMTGSQSWLANRLDPAAQAIVDFGDT